MRDLRPEYAAEIEEAISDLIERNTEVYALSDELRATMRQTIRDCLVPKRVRVEITEDEDAIAAFIEKYPEIRPALEKGQAEILEMWPSTEFDVWLGDDLENGSILQETWCLICGVDIPADDKASIECLEEWFVKWEGDNAALRDVFRFA